MRTLALAKLAVGFLVVARFALGASPTAHGQADGLTRALRAMGIRAALTGHLPRGVPYNRALALCAFGYPSPTTLCPHEADALERFVANGGRAYVEFVVRDDGGPLFGIRCAPKTLRAQHQRVFVTEDLYAISGLQRGDILDEHNSACLKPIEVPQGARVLLAYGLILGTYRALEMRPDYIVTVDLGQVRVVRSVAQRYGAGEPNYCPERVELHLGETNSNMTLGGVVERPGEAVVRFSVPDIPARYVRLICRKYKRSSVTDFFFMGEIEVLDSQGLNVSLDCPYTLSPAPSSQYSDSGRELTDGEVDGLYLDGLSVGWMTQPPENFEHWPALVEVPFGKGAALVALSKFSDCISREYRLRSRWEGLMRHIALFLVPDSDRDRIARRYVPLRSWTEPRTWTTPGTAVTVRVETTADAKVAATTRASRIELTRIAAGRYEGKLLPLEGDNPICVTARTACGSAKQVVRLRVCPREAAYRRALDRNMEWFVRSGVLPRRDGSQGVWAQRCLAWFDGGPIEFLPSPFRVDCNAATAQAFYLYGKLTGREEWLQRALNIAGSMLCHQYRDPQKPSFGGWPWLYEHSDAIFFWDDNTRVAVALLWLYMQTKNEELLRAGLRTMELCREVAQPDGLIARHVITASELDQIGRQGFRCLPPQGMAVDFDLKRWAWAYGVTGDPEYRELLAKATDVWGSEAGTRGLPLAVRIGLDPQLSRRLSYCWRQYMADPAVKRYGVPLAGPGDYQAAFVGDSSVTTTADDPLTDQLYVTPHLLLQAWWAYCVTRDHYCREAFQRVGDYLVRIQYESRDPRIDGAWMRGFDVEHWEVYGTPYDPAYGPYSAYTGWMNAFASTAFAQYLLDEDGLPPRPPSGGRAAAILGDLRAERPIVTRPENIAQGARYWLTPPPVAAYADRGGELTDGVLDGPYPDGRSVGWHLSEGQRLVAEMTIDLGAMRTVAAVAQRYGAGRGDYCPDCTEVWGGTELNAMSKVAEVDRAGAGPGRRFITFDSPVKVRYLRFSLSKRRVSPTTDFLFVGETEAFEEL